MREVGGSIEVVEEEEDDDDERRRGRQGLKHVEETRVDLHGGVSGRQSGVSASDCRYMATWN